MYAIYACMYVEGGEWTEHSPARKDLRGGWKAGHELAVCSHRPESQSHPGLHQKKCGKYGEGGDPALALN